MRACGACFYGRFLPEAPQGDCYLAPPAVTINTAQGEVHQARPTVLRNDFCGSFAHKTRIKARAAQGDTQDGEVAVTLATALRRAAEQLEQD